MSIDQQENINNMFEKPSNNSEIIQEDSNEFLKGQEKVEVDGEILEIESLKLELDSINDDLFIDQISDFMQVKRIEAELGGKKPFEEVLVKPIPENVQLEKTRMLVSEFYTEEKNKREEVPYAKEDIQKYFTEDNLSSISTEEYVKLLQQFPGEMLTHVTRHGIRDHADLGNHQAGLGEFHNSFQSILKQKELRSALGIAIQESSKEEGVAKFLELDTCESRNEALGKISGKFKSAVIGDSRAFADSSAVHLATEEVADSFYGGEKENEIFFAFPSVFIASQYEFSGDLANASSYNDQYVWPDIDKGLPLDAGIAFIPEDKMVNPKNGSKYEFDEENKTLPAEGFNEILKARFEKPGFVQTFIQKSKELNSLPEDKRLHEREKIFNEFEIKDNEAKKILSDQTCLDKLSSVWGKENEKVEYENILMDYYREKGVSPYKLASNSIPAKEYWEKYFQENPALCPKHIVYYSGANPTKALFEWRKKNGINVADRRGDMGFSENLASKDDKNEDDTHERFMSIARKLVDERFPSDEKNPSYEYDWSK